MMDFLVPPGFAETLANGTALDFDFDEEREQTIARIDAGSSYEVLDGVTLDFRHADLPEGKYKPEVTWWSPNGPADLRGPWNIPGGDLMPPPHALRSGDVVSISKVEIAPFPVSQVGDVRSDSHGRAVYMEVVRDGASCLCLVQPLWFIGLDSLMEVDLEQASEILVGRLDAMLDEATDPSKGGTYLRAAESYAEFFAEVLRDEVEASAEERIGLAMMLGYCIARAEGEQHVIPLAQAGTAALQQRRDAAAKGAATVRRSDWRDTALRIWSEHPHLTIHAVAAKIVETPGDASGIRSISRSIRNLRPT